MSGAKSSRSLVAQACPNCGKVHDTSVYVTGQQVQCSCGIRFEVKRGDVKTTANARGAAPELDVTVASSSPARQAEEEERKTSIATHPVVPGYELIELLGKGGMGEVWRARQLSLGRMVALKLLPSRFANDHEFVARFEKEANALASLSHPGIVQIIDRGQAGEHYYFTMELVPGINLREMMTQGRLPLRDALRISTQIARAIDYAHEMKIVHRDLKPENVLVDARGHVKIADFGLAGMKGNERDIALTATAVAMGTVNYMAPEQRRDAKNVDHRADLYSLGVLVYELLTGELPIGRFKAPSARVPELNVEVDEAVGQLLETDPAARPPNAHHLAELLEGLTPTSGLTRGTSLAPPGTSALNPVPRANWKYGALVLGALLLFGGALKFWPRTHARPLVAPAWYHDSDDTEVFSSLSAIDGGFTLTFDEQADGEELNLRCGMWKMEDGTLSALQYGDSTDDEVLRPRAYVAKRYLKSDRLDLSADMELAPLPDEFPLVNEDRDPRFGQLTFRIRDMNVSLHAIPGEGLGLDWHYFKPDGSEVEGSTSDAKSMRDTARVPEERFRVRMLMTPMKNGDVSVEAWVNGHRFAHVVLPDFGGTVGKVAVGCRNLSCRFDNLSVKGVEVARPEGND